MDLELNILKWLRCHKTKPNRISPLTHIVFYLGKPGYRDQLLGV